MKKLEIIAKIAEELKITKVAAGEMLTNVDKIIEVLAKEGSKSKIGEYITIETREVEEKEGRNPSNGEVLVIPAHTSVKVKATKALKELVK